MIISNPKIVYFVSVVFFFYSLNGYSASQSQDFEISEGTFDEQLVEISKRLPGFAGAFFDEDNNFVIVVSKDSEHKQPEDITQALLNSKTNIKLPVLDDLLELISKHGLIVQEATYDFVSLHQWRVAISKEIMSDPNVIFIDTNERENRIVIGVEDIKGKEQYLASISALNIPHDAIVIKKTAPILLSTTNIQAHEPATYDGSLLNIPLVEVNSQYFSNVKVTLNADGTWALHSIGGSDVNTILFDPDAEMFAPTLEVLTREPDSNFAFQAIARVTEATIGDTGCASLTALPQQIDGNIITVAITIIKPIDPVVCRLSLAPRSIDIELDTEDLSPGIYIVKYRGKSGEFILP